MYSIILKVKIFLNKFFLDEISSTKVFIIFKIDKKLRFGIYKKCYKLLRNKEIKKNWERI